MDRVDLYFWRKFAAKLHRKEEKKMDERERAKEMRREETRKNNIQTHEYTLYAGETKQIFVVLVDLLG